VPGVSPSAISPILIGVPEAAAPAVVGGAPAVVGEPAAAEDDPVAVEDDPAAVEDEWLELEQPAAISAAHTPAARILQPLPPTGPSFN